MRACMHVCVMCMRAFLMCAPDSRACTMCVMCMMCMQECPIGRLQLYIVPGVLRPLNEQLHRVLYMFDRHLGCSRLLVGMCPLSYRTNPQRNP